MEDLMLNPEPCKFSGSLAVVKEIPNLKRIRLDGCNQVVGDTSDFSEAENMKFLFLDRVGIHGTFEDFLKLPNLVNLVVTNTEISGNIGSVTSETFSVKNLMYLSVKGSEIRGSECDIKDYPFNSFDGNEPLIEKCPPHPNIAGIFQHFDKDNDEHLSKLEYLDYLKAIGLEEESDQLQDQEVWKDKICEDFFGLWEKCEQPGIPLDVFNEKQYGKDAQKYNESPYHDLKVGRYGKEAEDFAAISANDSNEEEQELETVDDQVERNSEPLPKVERNSEPLPKIERNSEPLPQVQRNSEPLPHVERKSEPLSIENALPLEDNQQSSESSEGLDSSGDGSGSGSGRSDES
eukprot:gnl/MRDRNA2_/MRDRNA2_138741_c0_seq1.p1 gnl/MRDRNA2_/MRDRNA2_138741_c0~~gnl/MRDRNA2_/MRDRNA2_138741_c0_seq1.p1  ORF type:complete len:393 (-),score=90.81 gnl/MRDRNA2_/MRDRNA2_138741_c0_seq1:91-1134(-)